ncbi:LytTR family transcriptional regulator DNA-binding domain-containing protein [Plebeiibacterium sediminum]|uniref:LytTR family transcriptional regulator DNA-binding domain-containing protein n=1 Tax=Plebeiibacterium sediminum TaxID=2992112 RepID=A0AAE3M266_9BACT|nr:LytTR family transcriptional regulator DNA-binding domain-containing protein [Plebeiobacterium sediminum]MCW3785753.1 LytTR family transcriptional regulator DNA-binding domain-containing protein [Plebeiobacterium sediminum]
MKSLFNLLNKPYPPIQNIWKSAFFIGLFISLFLYVFQPFGLQLMQHDHKELVLLGYGLVTFIVLIANKSFLPLIIPSVFVEEGWTIKKQILWLIWLVLTISLGNYLYAVLFTVIPWSGFNGLLVFMIFTIAIALIPIVLTTFITQNALLKKNIAHSQEINASIHKKIEKQEDIIAVESGKQIVNFNTDHIIAIESEGNYINMLTIEDDQVKSELIRNTIKNLEDQLSDRASFFKCHRAFIINLSYVQNVTGNSQGFNVDLLNLDKSIPVSRTYTKDFKKRMVELDKPM